MTPSGLNRGHRRDIWCCALLRFALYRFFVFGDDRLFFFFFFNDPAPPDFPPLPLPASLPILPPHLPRAALAGGEGEAGFHPRRSGKAVGEERFQLGRR